MMHHIFLFIINMISIYQYDKKCDFFIETGNFLIVSIINLCFFGIWF